MDKHNIGTREQWLAARLELLKEEKALTHHSDELARRRQELPWVRVDKTYRFDTDEGSATLADLFRGRSQLLIYHFMFGPEYTAGCPSCSSIADGFDGFAVHLANHDVTLMAVSRAPLPKLQAYKKRMGWRFPWASSFGGDFNDDYNVRITEEQQRDGRRRIQLPARIGVAVARRRRPRRPVRGDDRHRPRDLHARAAGPERVRARGRRPLSHLFAYARGLDGIWGMYQLARPRPHRAATRRASGGAATTSTTEAERCRGWPICRCPAAGRCR